MPKKPLVSAVLITRQDGFSNPTSKTGNCPSEANHYLTRTRCLCPEGETSGLERANPARIGGPDLSLWKRGGGRSDDAERRNTWRTLGILRRASGRAQKKTPRSRISLPWGSSGADRIRTCDLEVMSLASYRAAPPRVIGEHYCRLDARVPLSRSVIFSVFRKRSRSTLTLQYWRPADQPSGAAPARGRAIHRTASGRRSRSNGPAGRLAG